VGYVLLLGLTLAAKVQSCSSFCCTIFRTFTSMWTILDGNLSVPCSQGNAFTGNARRIWSRTPIEVSGDEFLQHFGRHHGVFPKQLPRARSWPPIWSPAKQGIWGVHIFRKKTPSKDTHVNFLLVEKNICWLSSCAGGAICSYCVLTIDSILVFVRSGFTSQMLPHFFPPGAQNWRCHRPSWK